MFRHAFLSFGFVLAGLVSFAQTPQLSDSSLVDSAAMLTDSAVEVAAEPETSAVEINSDIFKNVTASGKAEAIKLTWSIDYDAIEQLKGKQLIIRYCTSIEGKRIKKGYEGAGYSYSEPFEISNTSFTLKELGGHEKYEVYLGIAKEGNISEVKEDKSAMVWSSKVKTKTKRGWGIIKFLILIGSLGLFIFGMKVMSDGMQRTAGPRLRKMLGSITSNRVKGVLTGFSSTAIVQSSSVTTVMTVSLVNAGLLTLRQSAGVMMGANIGTTITAWLVLLLGFKVSISSYALILIAIGAPLMFFSFRRSKEFANTIIGFAILFIGLQFLKDSVPDLDKDSALVQFFVDYKDIPVLSNLMFVALGALVTIVIQSSSAAMALTLTMVSKGIIPFEVACAMVLGENIGTTITAEIASMIGNVHAKRSARIHSMFNIVGVTWMLLVIPLFLEMIGWLVGLSHGTAFDPANTGMANEGIALFHTCFNLANVVLLIWFVPQLVSIAERTVRSRGDTDEEFKLDYITSGTVGAVPEVALLEAKKEVAKFGKITSRMTGFVRVLINDQDKKKRRKMFNKIQKYEEITDRVEVEIASYLEKVAADNLTPETSMRVRSMLSITNDLERVGDIFYQMSKAIERKDDLKIYFMPEQRDKLNKMLDLVDKSFAVMTENLNSEYGYTNIDNAKKAEQDINQYRNELRKEYLELTEKGKYPFNNGVVYNDLFSSCEKIGDHIINVSEAVAGQI